MKKTRDERIMLISREQLHPSLGNLLFHTFNKVEGKNYIFIGFGNLVQIFQSGPIEVKHILQPFLNYCNGFHYILITDIN